MNVKNIINGFVKEVINIKKKEIIKQFQKNNNLSDEDICLANVIDGV